MSLYDALSYCATQLEPPAPRIKLTVEDVEVIRKRYATGRWSQQWLAREFGVSQPQISKIVNNLQWKDSSDG